MQTLATKAKKILTHQQPTALPDTYTTATRPPHPTPTHPLPKTPAKHWETIEGNCDSTLFLGGAEASTTEWISKRLGKETIHTTDNSESRGTSGSWSKQNRKLGRELLTQDELGRLPTNEAIYLLRGLPPFKGRKLKAPM